MKTQHDTDMAEDADRTLPQLLERQEQLYKLLVPELRKMLKEKGLPSSGLKQELVERLLEAEGMPSEEPSRTEGSDSVSLDIIKQSKSDAKRNVSQLMGRAYALMHESLSNYPRVQDAHIGLDAEFKVYRDIHRQYVELCGENEAAVAEGIFQDLEAEYQDCAGTIVQWSDQVSEQYEAEKKSLAAKQETAANVEKLAQRFESLDSSTSTKMGEMAQQVKQLQSSLTQVLQELKTVNQSPVKSDHSTPVRATGGRRVSFELTPTLSSETDQADSVADSTLAAISTMADSFKDALQEVKQKDVYEGPKIKLVKFSGEAIRYWPFIKSFEKLVEGKVKNPATKLALLIEHTTGDVQEMLQSCLLKPDHEGYTAARALLSEQYGSDDDVVQAWINKLSTMPVVETVADLRKLLNMLRTCQETISAMKKLDEFQTRGNLKIILDKVPPQVKEEWQNENDSIVQNGGRMKLANVIKIIQKVVRIRADPFFGSEFESRVVKSGVKSASKKVYTVTDNGGPDVNAAANVYSDGCANMCNQVNNNYPVTNSQFSPSKHVYHAGGGPGNMPRMFPERGGNSRPPDPCVVCKSDHMLYRCEQFKAMSVENRCQVVEVNRLCGNCLLPRHYVRRCRSSYTCQFCQKRHHSLLHDDAGTADRILRPRGAEAPEPRVIATTTYSGGVALPVVAVIVEGPAKREICYAMLDGGAGLTMCTKALARRLGLPTEETVARFTTVDGTTRPEKCWNTAFKIQRVDKSKEEHTLPRVVAKDHLYVPASCKAASIDVQQWPHLSKLEIPTCTADKVDIIVGQDYPGLIVTTDTEPGKAITEPIGIDTELGWYVAGPVGGSTPVGAIVCCTQMIEENLAEKVEKFWKVDGLHCASTEPAPSRNDDKVTEFWKNGVRMENGHFVLGIPFKDGRPNLPDNRAMAEERLTKLQRRLYRDPTYRKKYTDCVKEMKSKGYLEVVPSEKEKGVPGAVWYSPTLGVEHPRKPDKVRVVGAFNTKYRGTSLNDAVHSGPDLMNGLMPVLTKFRTDAVAVICDVEGMFNQVVVEERDRDVLRILWWKDDVIGGDVQALRYTRHPFGGVWSPSAANFAMRHAGVHFHDKFDQEAVDAVNEKFYMDDGLLCSSEVEAAKRLVDQLKGLLGSAGFNLVKFLSNKVEVLRAIPESDLSKKVKLIDVEVDGMPNECTLGLWWDPNRDCFFFVYDPKERANSKRGLLSGMMEVFDPQGMLTPATMKIKLVFQQACKEKLMWDQTLPEELIVRWRQWREEMKSIEKLTFPRCLLPEGVDSQRPGLRYQLHHFSDASEKAYGAASYLRVEDEEGRVTVRLIMSKGRVAPIRSTTVPRLELMGACTSVQQNEFLCENLPFEFESIWYWTDSTVVLYYLRNDGKRYLVFVANRVNFIRDNTEITQWRHISTDCNPADLISRGAAPEELAKPMWTEGPEVLKKDPELWPSVIPGVEDREKELEIKKEDVLVMTTAPYEKPSRMRLDMYLEKEESWHKMKKGLCYIVKFIHWAAKRKFEKKISVHEMQHMNTAVIKYVQQRHMDNPTTRGQVQKLMPIKKDELLRVGGRLAKAPIPEGQRHPILIPKHPIARAIARDIHEQYGHAGSERMLAVINRRYWLLRGRRMIRHLIYHCHHCRKMKAPLRKPVMADLPEMRVTGDEPPFTKVGADYAGPFLVKEGRREVKRWFMIITCYSTRAVWLEPIYNLTADSCLLAFQRFVAAKGMPKFILTDNGTNFVGAKREWCEAFEKMDFKYIEEYFRLHECVWMFNPPAASHMGGLWERIIRTIREILVAMLRGQQLTTESFHTFLMIIADIINARPITAVSSDPSDPAPLCPNDLMRPNTAVNLPWGIFTDRDRFRRKWRQVQYLGDVFWSRWREEYLPLLQARRKWLREQGNLKVGDLVIIHEEHAPRNVWPTARVLEVYPSTDGRVRSVKLVTRAGELRRPVHELVLVEGVE